MKRYIIWVLFLCLSLWAGSGIETVTPMFDTDGHWRVSGYFIK